MPAFLAFVWYFLTVAVVAMLDPVRNALLFADFSAAVLPRLYMASALAAGAAVWGYTRFSGARRPRLIGGAMLALSASLLGWWALVRAAAPAGWISCLLYLFTDVFSIAATTLFWSYAGSVFTPKQSRRLFGPIAAAGSLGAIFGSWVIRSLVQELGVPSMLLIAALTYGLSLPVMAALERRAGPGRKPGADILPERPPTSLAGLPGSMRAIGTSPYLLLIALAVCLERMVPDFSNYIFSAVTSKAYPDPVALAAMRASVGMWGSAVALAANLATPGAFVLFGLRGVLASAPLANLLGFTAFLAAPGLPTAVAHSGLENLLRCSWFKSGKESLYTALDEQSLFQLKAVIDMFFYKLSRGAAGLILLVLTDGRLLGFGLPAATLLGIPLSAFWVYVAWRLGGLAENAAKARA